MARRLTPEARRAEIIQRTREYIGTQGPAGMSLRAVARWCDMSAPGLLHYFDGLKPLLETVLSERDAEEFAAATALVEALGDRGTLEDFVDGLVRRLESNADETRNFDALESEAAASPDHPAHDYYLNHVVRPHPATIALAAREYNDPDAVVAVVGLVADGLRLRWLRSPTPPDYLGDWARVRDTVFAGFERLRKTPTDSE